MTNNTDLIRSLIYIHYIHIILYIYRERERERDEHTYLTCEVTRIFFFIMGVNIFITVTLLANRHLSVLNIWVVANESECFQWICPGGVVSGTWF